MSDEMVIAVMVPLFLVVSAPDAYLWNREKASEGSEKAKYRKYRNIYSVFALAVFFLIFVLISGLR